MKVWIKINFLNWAFLVYLEVSEYEANYQMSDLTTLFLGYPNSIQDSVKWMSQ